MPIESLFIDDGCDTLHLARISENTAIAGDPIFMLHGAIENGRIFYSESGKGLAPYLARELSCEVFVGDMRGRGKSTPAIRRSSPYSQTQAIVDDIRLMHKKICEIHPQKKQVWVAHSWGGILMASYLARFPENLADIKCLVFIGSKRCVRVQNWEKWLKIDLIWHTLSPFIIALAGYLPARKLGLGSDNETRLSHKQGSAWVKPSPWIDTIDGFDYGKAIRELNLPPILHLTGSSDRCLGHPQDVNDFIKELGNHRHTFKVLGKDTGHVRNYDHIDILTHPDAVSDHFPLIAEFISNSLNKRS